MTPRHLRRSRVWWVGRAASLLALAALGGVVGAGATVALDETGDGASSGRASMRPQPGPATLALAGEVRPGEALTEVLGEAPDDLPGPFRAVLAAADLAVVGLSAAVVPEPVPGGPAAATSVPLAVLDELAVAGIDVVSLANDRAADLGAEGVVATVEASRSRRPSLVGIGVDEDAAYAPVLRNVGGHRVAVIAAAQRLDPSRIAADTAAADHPGVASAKRVDRLVAAVEAAEADADVVVVYLHWGEDGQTCPSTGQMELADALVSAGADVVAGSGAGAVQGAGRYGDAVVAYGLGGLVSGAATEAGVLQVEVGSGGVTGWSWLPGRVVEGVAVPLDPAEAPSARADLDARMMCARLGT